MTITATTVVDPGRVHQLGPRRRWAGYENSSVPSERGGTFFPHWHEEMLTGDAQDCADFYGLEGVAAFLVHGATTYDRPVAFLEALQQANNAGVLPEPLHQKEDERVGYWVRRVHGILFWGQYWPVIAGGGVFYYAECSLPSGDDAIAFYREPGVFAERSITEITAWWAAYAAENHGWFTHLKPFTPLGS